MFWNRINVENKGIILDNNPYYIEIDNEVKLDIVVNENISSKLVIIASSNYDINIKLNRNSSLIVNSLNKNNSVNVNISLLEESNINYNHSVLTNSDSINNFNILHKDSNSISNLNNNGININSGKLFFIINGKVPNKLNNITCNQKSKIINYSLGNSKIIPNLIIDSNDIIASHSAYIGKIDDDDIFYMTSRGINKSDIQKIIYKATLLGIMNLDEEKDKFNKILNEWW